MWPFPHAKYTTYIFCMGSHGGELDKSLIFQKEPIYRGSEYLWNKHLAELHSLPTSMLLTCISPPFLTCIQKKQEINGPVLRMQLVNAMQWLKQLPRMYFFVLWAGRDHSYCPFALHTKMLGKSMRMIYLSNGTEVVLSWHVCIARVLLP